jgi:hypothetical protein
MLYIFLSALALGALFLATGCSAEEKTAPEKTGEQNATPEKGEKPTTPVLTREQIKDRLQRLSQMPKPKPEQGAMCYKAAAIPVKIEYVCPKCNEKTIYPLSNDGGDKDKQTRKTVPTILEWELSACRRMIGTIHGLAVELDESQFCKKCSPDVVAPSLVLVVRHPGQKEPHRFARVNLNDLQMLVEFLAGEVKHKDSYETVTPLADYLKRLEELLGVKLEAK